MHGELKIAHWSAGALAVLDAGRETYYWPGLSGEDLPLQSERPWALEHQLRSWPRQET